MKKLKAGVAAILGSSILWGVLGSLGFFALIHNRVLPASELLERYTTTELVQRIETIFFFIGVAELILKAFDVAEQRSKLRKKSLLDGMLGGPWPAADARTFLDHMASLPERDKHGYLPNRLTEAFGCIIRKGSADTIDEELRYLSELDHTRSHAGFAFTRIVIWSIPIWGFLGTVLGITDAISSLNPKAMETSLTEVTSSLGGVFDTTALALTLSIGLMFMSYFVDRMEGQFLGEVDRKMDEELIGRFEKSAPQRDPQVAVVQDMAAAMINSSERLVERQAAVWQTTIEAAHRRWSELTAAGKEHLEAALLKTLSRSVQAHAEHLAAAEAAAAEKNRRHWGRIHKALVDSSQIAQNQHVELVKQGEILLQVVEATGQVTKLEQSLNSNLSTLAGAQHLQETLLSLSAAIQLLNARLAQLTPLTRPLELKDHSASKAA